MEGFQFCSNRSDVGLRSVQGIVCVHLLCTSTLRWWQFGKEDRGGQGVEGRRDVGGQRGRGEQRPRACG